MPAKVETWLGKTWNSLWSTIEQAVLAIPAVLFVIFGNPGPFFTAVKYVLLGLVWIYVADFLIDHTSLLKDILLPIQIFAKVTAAKFKIDVGKLILKADAGIALVNLAGDGVNFLTGHHTVPHIGYLDPLLPEINFQSFIDGLTQFISAQDLCTDFDSLWYELSYPFRSLLNGAVCPIVRYTWGSLIGPPFGWLMGLFYFDADPNGNNCADPSGWTVCFILRFGTLLVYILAPLHIFFWLLPPLRQLLARALDLAGDLIRLGLVLLIGLLHVRLQRKPTKKSK